jgi:hypothetical protein
MKKCCCILFLFLSVFNAFADQVEANNKSIANASPDDFIIRANGEKIILKQADIDYAKKQFRMEYSQNSSYSSISSITNTKFTAGTNHLLIFIIVIGIILF